MAAPFRFANSGAYFLWRSFLLIDGGQEALYVSDDCFGFGRDAAIDWEKETLGKPVPLMRTSFRVSLGKDHFRPIFCTLCSVTGGRANHIPATSHAKRQKKGTSPTLRGAERLRHQAME